MIHEIQEKITYYICSTYKTGETNLSILRRIGTKYYQVFLRSFHLHTSISSIDDEKSIIFSLKPVRAWWKLDDGLTVRGLGTLRHVEGYYIIETVPSNSPVLGFYRRSERQPREVILDHETNKISYDARYVPYAINIPYCLCPVPDLI